MPAAADPVRLKDLAAELGCDVEGDGEFLVRGVAGLETASGSELSFARDGLVDRLATARVSVSVRGNSIRIAPHLHTTDGDVERLFEVLSG